MYIGEGKDESRNSRAILNADPNDVKRLGRDELARFVMFTITCYHEFGFAPISNWTLESSMS